MKSRSQHCTVLVIAYFFSDIFFENSRFNSEQKITHYTYLLLSALHKKLIHKAKKNSLTFQIFEKRSVSRNAFTHKLKSFGHQAHLKFEASEGHM